MGYGVDPRRARVRCLCGAATHRTQVVCPDELQRLKTYSENITALYNELRASTPAQGPLGGAVPLSGDASMLRLLERARRVCHPDVNSSPVATEVTRELNEAIAALRSGKR